MNFFVNYDFPLLLSGVEHAQIKRLRAFLNHKTEAKIVTVAYNRFLDSNLSKNQVDSEYVINMYDYFQKVNNKDDSIIQHRTVLQDIISLGEYISFVSSDYYEVELNGVHTKTIFVMKNPFFQFQVDKVDIYDSYDNKIRTDYYDIRGFLSMSDIYGQRGGVARQVNYDLNGNVVLDSCYQFDNNQKLQIDWSLLWDGKRYFFQNKSQLQSKFYDLINEEYKNSNIFISDRAYATDDGLINMKSKRKMMVFWHNVFVPENGIANISKPFDTLINQINHSDEIDALLAATEKEVKDLKIATGNRIPVKKLNSYVTQSERRDNCYKEFAERPIDIVTVARISSEKRILLGIEMFAKVHEINPDITWQIFGYGSDDYMEIIKDAIRAKNLTDFITINHYSYDLDNIYRKSKVFWVTSKFEGFNMAQMEAQYCGVPTIGFDVDYGPGEAIFNKVNGFLIEDNDINDFVNRTIQILEDKVLWSEMSQHAINNTQKYSDNHLMDQWRSINNF